MMKRVAAFLVAIGAICLAVDTLRAGAKEGKMRWTHEKTGSCKWFPAIKVPAGKDGTPGVHTLKITFKADQRAEFFVVGDGDTDLDLYVYDARGKKVAQDEDPPADQGGGSDLCVCRWRPAREEEYTIQIVNRGTVYNVACAGCN
jgi:hypothetical protein